MWTVVPIRPSEDPSVKTSREELTRGVVVAYVEDLLLTGWQHHIDAITQALLVKYVMFQKRSGLLPYCVQGESTSGAPEGIDFLGARITGEIDGYSGVTSPSTRNIVLEKIDSMTRMGVLL